MGSTSSAYSNINFNAHIYSGFYLLSENYKGLLLTLGFKMSDFEYLPTANAHYGVGVLLTPTVTFASNISTVNYAINTNFPNLNDLTKSYVIDAAANITTPEIIDLSYPR